MVSSHTFLEFVCFSVSGGEGCGVEGVLHGAGGRYEQGPVLDVVVGDGEGLEGFP